MPTPEVAWIPLTSPGFLHESPYSVHHHECILDYSPFSQNFLTFLIIVCSLWQHLHALHHWQVLGLLKKETLPEIYILDFHALASRLILIVKFLRVWPVMFIMTVVFIIGNLSWTVCSLTGSPIHKAVGIKWSAVKELFTEYWHAGTNSRHNKSNPMSWLVLDIKYRSKGVLQTM